MDKGNYEHYAVKTNLPAWEESRGTVEMMTFWRHKTVRLGTLVVSPASPRGYYVHHADGYMRSFLEWRDAWAFIVAELGSYAAACDQWQRVEIPRV